MTFKNFKKQAFKNQKIIKLVFEKVDSRYYYVYRITNTKENKHYYGSRVSKVIPQYDLGIKYFSSSDILQKEIISNPENFKYKVVKILDNNGDKILWECYLHQYFDVKMHDSFYNKANQRLFGYDTTGMVSCLDNEGNKLFITQKEFYDRNDVHHISKKHNIGKLNPMYGVKKSKESNKKAVDTRIKNNSYVTGNIKALKTRRTKNENGMSPDEIGAAKAKKTKSIIGSDGLTVNQRTGNKLKNTLATEEWKNGNGEIQKEKTIKTIKNLCICRIFV